jgi:GxxExxY protein
MLRELALRGIRANGQVSLAVTYKGHPAGEYFAGILVEDKLVVESKCVDRLANLYTAQCLNYLRASDLGLCLLVNFQNPRVEWNRIIQGFHVPERAEEPAAFTYWTLP